MSASELSTALHDSVIQGIGFEWSDGSLEATVRTATGQRTLSLKEVREVRLSRRNPWGPSAQIDRLVIGPSSEGTPVTLQMQSGGSIEVICGSVDLSEPY